MFTETQLEEILSGNPNIKEWHEALLNILPDYEINTTERIAAFLAQCAHESNGFKAIKENLNYKATSLRATFPKYFTTDETAEQYAHNQEKIANRVYANRMGNGNEASGDGYKYCGRGLIQLTGRDNYQAFADSIETPLASIFEYLATFEGAVQSAAWFWETNNLNKFADAEDILGLTKRINGGTIGLEDRVKRYEKAKEVLCGS